MKDEECNLLEAEDGSRYRTGFHAFTDIDGASDWSNGNTIARFKFRDIRCVGRQNGYEVLVAGEMKFVELVDDRRDRP